MHKPESENPKILWPFETQIDPSIQMVKSFDQFPVDILSHPVVPTVEFILSQFIPFA